MTAFAAYVHEFLEGTRARLVALVLAVLYFSPILPLLDWLGLISLFDRFEFLLISGELMPAWQMWGYLHAVIAVALLALALLATGRAVEAEDPSTRRRLAAWSAGAGLMTSWLHPWQGLTLLLIIAAVVAWGGVDRRLRVLAAPFAGAAAPIAGYAVLALASRQWEIAADQNHADVLPWLFLLGALAPLAAVSALGVRWPVDSVRERMLVLWPLAAFVVYLAVGNGRPRLPGHEPSFGDPRRARVAAARVAAKPRARGGRVRRRGHPLGPRLRDRHAESQHRRPHRPVHAAPG